MKPDAYACRDDLTTPEACLKRAYEFKSSYAKDTSKKQVLVMKSFLNTLFYWGFWTFSNAKGKETSIDDLVKTSAFKAKTPSEQERVKRLIKMAEKERTAFFEDPENVKRAKKMAKMVSESFSKRDLSFSRIVGEYSRVIKSGKIVVICDPRKIFLLRDSYDSIVSGKTEMVERSSRLLSKGACLMSLRPANDDSGKAGEVSVWIVPGKNFGENGDVIVIDNVFHTDYLFSEFQVAGPDMAATDGFVVLSSFVEALQNSGLKPKVVYMEEVD